MEELMGHKKRTMTNKSSRITKKSFQKSMEETLVKEYEDTDSPAFGKNSQTVKQVVLRKYPRFKGHLTDKFTRDTLNRLSTTYSMMRTLRHNKHFHGTSFYSTHPHYRWQVDLQDMSIFRQAANLQRQDANSFLLICIDDFSNYFMVEPIKDKKAMTVFNAFAKIVRREWALPTIVYCDKGSELNNKIFNNKMKLGFRVQFTINRRKAVYAE